MATELQAFSEKFIESVLTTQYTVPTSKKNKILRCMAINNGANTATLTIHVVPFGGTPSTSNRVVFDAIRSGDSRNIYELVGKIIDSGGYISAIASAASSIVMSCDIYEY